MPIAVIQNIWLLKEAVVVPRFFDTFGKLIFQLSGRSRIWKWDTVL